LGGKCHHHLQGLRTTQGRNQYEGGSEQSNPLAVGRTLHNYNATTSNPVESTKTWTFNHVQGFEIIAEAICGYLWVLISASGRGFKTTQCP
jgi:hypothetical protein